MFIRKANERDLDRILEIYGIAREFMIKSGNPSQWGLVHPAKEIVLADIDEGISHVVCEGEEIRGVFALLTEEEPTYGYIEGGAWLNDEAYVTIHRIASDQSVHGLFPIVFDYCKGLSDNIRIDTHADNLPMQRQIEKCGFVRCGTIYVRGKSARIAYHWCKEPDRVL